MVTKGEYVALNDFAEIAEKIVLKYPDKYGDLPINKIKFYGVLNRERSSSKNKIYNWFIIPEAFSQECMVEAVCVVFFSNWASLPDKNKNLVVASALSCLQFDGECVRSKGFDLKDHKDMVEMFGANYEDSADVPDIL
jgi:hypothetical protein